MEVYKKNGCDSIMTLGGGSSHDSGAAVDGSVSVAIVPRERP